MSELLDIDFGEPLHSLVIAGETHPLERDVLAMYAVTADHKRLPPASSQTDYDSS